MCAFAAFLTIDFCLRDGAGFERAATIASESTDNSEEDEEIPLTASKLISSPGLPTQDVSVL